jgi:capsular exopolysaccharide synthesis family protein
MGSQQTQFPLANGATEQPRPPVTGGEVGDTSLSEALTTLRKQRWVLVLAAVLGVSYGAYKAYTQPRLFEADATIQVHNGASNQYRLDSSYFYGDDELSKLNTEVAILKSDSLMETVASEMDLANNQDFLGVKGPMPKRSLDDPAVRASVVETLQSNLQVNMQAHSELIHISYSSLSAKLSADIVNKVVFDYIQRSYHTPVERTRMVSQWLSSQLDELKSEVEHSQQQMMDLQRKLGVMGYDSTAHNQLQTSLEGLLTAEGAAKVARITAESRYRMIAGMDSNTIDESIETTPGTAPMELNLLRGQLAVAKTNYQQLTTTLGVNHPQAKALAAQIAELTKEIDTEQSRLQLQAKESYLAAKAAEEKTGQELEARKAEVYSQGDDLVQYTLLQQQYEQNRTLYDGLEQKLRMAEVQAGLEALEVDVVDPARPPVNPTLQSRSTVILTTTLFFLLGGVVVAFILEGLDTGLHSIQQIEAVMELPSLAIIPQAKRLSVEQAESLSPAERNVTVLSQTKSQFAESFRSLRTALLLVTAGQPPKFILFTSAMPSEGKTTAATNLACILAQGEARVLLLDADLRRPTIHHRFGLTGKLGLTTVLAGSSTLEEAVQHLSEAPNLDILPSGPVPPFPTEMLSSEAMQALMERIGKLYTHVVIDSPPVLSVTDGVVLARMVDAVVLVIRHGKSSKNALRRSRDLLVRSGAPMAGLVLNAVDVNSPDYYGYYGHSGYSYRNVDAESWETTGSAATGDSGPERRDQR